MSEQPAFDLRKLLHYTRRKTMGFSEYVDQFIASPSKHLYTSSMLIAEAVRYFGFKVVIRGGEPVVSYNIFKDSFSNGVNAVYGQEISIKKLVDVIESISKESGPNRGIVLLGPPASGKTNIIDLISMALEQYTKEENIKLYSFYYSFPDVDNPEKTVEIRSSFQHNPLLLFTTILHQPHGITKPRQTLFEHINENRSTHEKIVIPTYYQNASLDKRNLDIIENLLLNPRNEGKSLFDILEEYVRIEEIEFSNAQAQGIANIDSMKKLNISVQPPGMRDEAVQILNQHLPSTIISRYNGALVSSNRGLLHIHDAFADGSGESYRPLLMLLGSGRVSLESSQTSVDTVVVITTNLEDMEGFDSELTSGKLLDRIEKIPVNYLLDASSEMDILKRDMSIIQDRYDIDPNLFRVASYFSVMTRLFPPQRTIFPETWSDAKKEIYSGLTPEQKLFIYCAQPIDPIATVRALPFWHPFRNQIAKLGIDIYEQDQLAKVMHASDEAPSLESCGLFTAEELDIIDDAFAREVRLEYENDEGRLGISIRQLQNIMRNTISNSDGRSIVVNSLIEEFERVVNEGSRLHHWLKVESEYERRPAKAIPPRSVGGIDFQEGEADYGDFKGIIKVVRSLYHLNIVKEIVTATVDRDPIKTEEDLRKYVQHVLLSQAMDNKAFSHIMIPRFSYLDPKTGNKVDSPDLEFLKTIESVIIPEGTVLQEYRQHISHMYFDAIDTIRLKLETGKTLINSRKDTFLKTYETEFQKLLSHRRTEDGLDGRELTKAFYHKRHSPEDYLNLPREVRLFAETVLNNLGQHYGYSPKIALDTVVYALRERIIDFAKILN